MTAGLIWTRLHDLSTLDQNVDDLVRQINGMEMPGPETGELRVPLA
eukprot:SAG11_NODE_12237_length_714_cov_0.835772_1_plen_45_part_10